MQHKGKPCRGKLIAPSGHLPGKFLVQLTVNMRIADATFFKDAALGNRARATAAAAGPLPYILTKPGADL
jgi:hypothetical protein